MGRIKYKKYQAVRESIPAFTLNQIGKVALNRAKAGERYQYLEIITSQLMCGLTLEAVLNYIGKKLSDNWEERERKLSIEKKIKEIAKGIGLDKQLDSYPFQLRHEISDFRNKIVHAKSSKHVAKEIRQDQIDEDGFPIVPSVSELMTDWEKSCSIDTAEKWRKAVENMSSILSKAAKCDDPIKIGGAIDTYGELES